MHLALLPLLLSCSPEPADPCAVDLQAASGELARLQALETAVLSGCWDLGELERRCASLEGVTLQAACQRYLGRPHLLRGAALQAGSEAPPGRRPSCPSACDGATSPLDCVVEHALAGAEGPGCGCLEQPLARDECAFRIAQHLGPQGGLEACLDAGRLKGPCLHHHAEALGARCAPLDAGGVDGWGALVRDSEALEAAVSHWDEFERMQLRDVVWAGSMRCAFQHPQAFDPALTELLPHAATPHLRAALAWHVVAAGREQGADLPSWARSLERYLNTGLPPDSSLDAVEIPAGPGQGWAHDAAAWCRERERRGGRPCGPARRYFGMGKRLWSEEAAVDGSICLLEAAARLRDLDDLPEPGPGDDASLRGSAEALRAWRPSPPRGSRPPTGEPQL